MKVSSCPTSNTPGPGSIANEMQSDHDVTQALLPFDPAASRPVTTATC